MDVHGHSAYLIPDLWPSLAGRARMTSSLLTPLGFLGLIGFSTLAAGAVGRAVARLDSRGGSGAKDVGQLGMDVS